MRALILAFVLIATSAPAQTQSSPAANGPELKPFQFLKFTAGEVIPPALVKGCGKKPDVTCDYPLMRISKSYVTMVVVTHDYKLSTLYLDAHPNSYPDLLEAFTAKYGPPCEAIVAFWKNAMGAELENPTYRWCFSTGKLTFSKYGSRLDKMAIFYEDANQPPKAAPVINF